MLKSPKLIVNGSFKSRLLGASDTNCTRPPSSGIGAQEVSVNKGIIEYNERR